MADHLGSLEGDEANLLQSALSTAFSPAPLPHQSVSLTPGSSSIVEVESSSAEERPETADEASASFSEEAWKAEYESHVQSWRAQSAEAREKAEKERARWEAIRLAESEEAAKHKAEHGWENIGDGNPSVGIPTGIPSRVSPVPGDARDLVTGESSRSTAKPFLSGPSSNQPSSSQVDHSRHDTGEDSKLSGSQKWEDVASEATSSFPSMSFPERSETPSPSTHEHPSTQPPAAPAPAPLSATLAAFDSSLTTRTRVSAIFSSFAINMLLPFVNGVMLGFGEIFAKNVVIGWFGWKLPATPVVGTVGIGVPLPSERTSSRKRPSSS